MNGYCNKAVFFLMVEIMVTPSCMDEGKACTLKGFKFFVARYPGKCHAMTGS